MRISQTSLFRNALAGLTVNLAALGRAGGQVASGSRIQRLSDDPEAARTVMGLRSQLRNLDLYRGSANLADVRLSAEDAALGSVDQLLTQAKDLAATVARSADPEMRDSALQQLKAIRDQVVSLGNTEVSGDYIFAGSGGDGPAFDPDGTYIGSGDAPTAELWGGSRVTVNHTGDQALTGAITALDGLTDSVAGGDAEAIQASLEDVGRAARNLHAVRAETGNRMRSVSESLRAVARQNADLANREQDLAGADPTESLLKMNEAKTALDRAYEAVSKVLNTNLLQFLK